jgi:hypothetical protein
MTHSIHPAHRAGLAIFGLLSVADVIGLVATDGEHPPYAIAAIGAVLGLVSLWLVVRIWRGDWRGIFPLLGLRVLSALTAVPAFFVSDVPTAAVVAAAAIVALTAVAVLLLRPESRSTKVAA